MMSKAELEEIKKLNSKFDMIFKEFMKRNEAKCAPIENYPRRDEVIFKTYEIVKRMNNGDPISAKSDTFVFVEGKMVVHRRAKYIYYAE